MSIDDAWDEPTQKIKAVKEDHIKEMQEFWSTMKDEYVADKEPFGVNSDEMEANIKFDIIEKPAHYVRNGYECIELIKAITKGLDGYEGYLVGNVVKYLFRYNDKNGVEDIKKIQKYVKFLLEEKEA